MCELDRHSNNPGNQTHGKYWTQTLCDIVIRIMFTFLIFFNCITTRRDTAFCCLSCFWYYVLASNTNSAVLHIFTEIRLSLHQFLCFQQIRYVATLGDLAVFCLGLTHREPLTLQLLELRCPCLKSLKSLQLIRFCVCFFCFCFTHFNFVHISDFACPWPWTPCIRSLVTLVQAEQNEPSNRSRRWPLTERFGLSNCTRSLWASWPRFHSVPKSNFHLKELQIHVKKYSLRHSKAAMKSPSMHSLSGGFNKNNRLRRAQDTPAISTNLLRADM